MKILPVVLGATALSLVLASQAHADVVNITGSLAEPAPGSVVVTYPGGDPTFTGTYDDVTGAFEFTFDTAWSAHLVAFNVYVADSTNNADGTVSAGTVGDAFVSTNSTSCTGSPLICNNLGGATTLYGSTNWDGTTGTVVGSTTSNGITALSTYNINLAPNTGPGPVPPAPPVTPGDPTAVPTLPLYGLGLTILGLLSVAGRHLRSPAKRK